MKRIQDIVDKYRKDTITRKAYMTLEQKLNIRYKNGLAKGEEEGRVKCRKEGRAEANKELAKAFCDAGVKVISEKTGLTPEEIKAL